MATTSTFCKAFGVIPKTKADLEKLLVAERKKERAKHRASKPDVNKLLVAERKKMRTKAQQSEFMKRSINIYKGQVTRAAEEGVRQKRDLSLDYDLREFRLFLSQALGDYVVGKMSCAYCRNPLKVKSFVCDHREAIARGGVFTIDNIAVCCKSCNWQKGQMNEGEFILLRNLIYDNLPTNVASDFMKRLSLGGKWAAQLHI